MLAYCSVETNGAGTRGATAGAFAARTATVVNVAAGVGGTGVAASVGRRVDVGLSEGMEVGVKVGVSVGTGVFVGSSLANFVGPESTGGAVGEIASAFVFSEAAKGLSATQNAPTTSAHKTTMEAIKLRREMNELIAGPRNRKWAIAADSSRRL